MNDLELITQPSQRIQARVSLLDSDLERIGLFTGEIISMTFDFSNTSDIRRTMALSVTSKDAGEALAQVEGFWIDKIVQVEYGVFDRSIGVFKWFLLGTFVLADSDYTVGVGAQQIDMTLIDLMGCMTEARGSQIGHDVIVYMDSDIKAALTATLTDFTRLTQHDIVNFDLTVPYDLEFDKGVYPYEIAKSMVELLPYYQHSFTRDGVYKVELIPLSYTENPVMTAEEMKKIVISESGGGNYAELANVIEVWGRELDAQYTATSCTTDANWNYVLYVDDAFEVMESGMTISFVPDTTSYYGQSLRIQDLPAYPLYGQKGDGTYYTLGQGAMEAGTAYVLKWVADRFVLQGELLIHALAMEFNTEPTEEQKQAFEERYDCKHISFIVNPGSKFAADHEGLGIVKKVLTGGDYDHIYTVDLALERARYELWKASRLKNSKEITCVYAPWLDVNQKISYTSIATGETNQYLIESITGSFDGTMRMTISQFFPLYQWIDSNTWGGLTPSTWGDLKTMTWGDLTRYGGDN